MISRAIPKLPFIDKQATLHYYVEKMGFQLQADYGDYLIIAFPEAELHFFAYPTLLPEKSDFMVYLRVQENIHGLYVSLQEMGVDIHPNGKLEQKPWGQIEFSLLDPNGTLLTYGQQS